MQNEDLNQDPLVVTNSISQSSFSISQYMLKIILPKCVMAYGGIMSSVYFQIAFNINNQEKAKSWQYQKCWKNPNKIAEEIGYNSRKVKQTLKLLSELGLLENSLRGKLKMYRLLNDKIVNEKQMVEFITTMEKNLIASVPKENATELRDKFSQLNDFYKLSLSENSREMLKRLWIPDMVFLKKAFIQAEQMYKGSSLFFMEILEDKFKSFKKNANVLYNQNNNVSEAQRALRIGCSQATLSRYVTTYKDSIVLKEIDKKLSELLEHNMMEIKSSKKSNEGVVNKMSEIEYYCPICERHFDGTRSLGMHLGKMKDEKHVWFNQLRKEKKTPWGSFSKLYEEYKSQVETSTPDKVITDEYMKVPCPCKMSCKECRLNWGEEFFKPCTLERKAAFVKEYGLEEEVQKDVKKTKKVKEVDFEELPENKKPVHHGEDTAPGLLKFFYDMTGGRSPSWGKECGQIKSQLKKGLTPDETRVVLKHMARKGQMDLRFFSTSINDALLENKFMNELEQEGTPAYLVKYFYESHGLQVNIQTLVKDVQKIQETLNSGLTYEQAKIVLDYMISQKCTILNFIASKRTEALARYQGGVASTPVSNFKSNPSFFDQSELNIIRDDLAGGRTRINKVKENLREQAIEVAKQLFVERKFTTRYTPFEWAWRVGLELNEELYKIGVKEINKETYIDFALRNNDHIDPSKLQTLEKLKASFEKWVQKQHEAFGSGNLFTVN